MKRALPVLIFGALSFVGLEAAIFHTGFYGYWASPDSSAGYLETILYNERIRPKNGPNQVVGIGDSRMALVAKFANELQPTTGYTFASLGVAGSTPRGWYYMLRDADPKADQYRAIVFTLESFDDEDTYEDLADRVSDLNYLIGRLRIGDIREFSNSFHTRENQLRAARGIALKGLVYQRDVQAFLSAPLERIRYVKQSWRDSHLWFYDFRGDDKSLAPLSVDWETRKLSVAPGTPPEREQALRERLVDPIPPQTGLRHEYMTYWLNRIYSLYQSSKTRLIFVRVPRAPWIRPDLPPSRPDSAVRQLAKYPNVTILPEDLFNELERPELFRDEVHLNQPGLDRFTTILAHRVREVLGPPL